MLAPILSLPNLKGDIAAFDVAVRLQPAAKVVPNQRIVDDTHPRQPICWLRTWSNGPRDRDPSEPSDELTPPHLTRPICRDATRVSEVRPALNYLLQSSRA